jgi:2-hydroxy-6-oxonona-2,4-dienedioate hydrolase
MRRRSFIGLASLGVLAAATGFAARDYRRAVAAARARVERGSTVIATRAGAMEYAEAGVDPPVLMIHGTGGGFDQGLGFARPLSQAGFRVVAPSRFGYLRSDFPQDASSEAQADALIDLLDELRIERVAVVGGSAGALPALAFAIRHPTRTAALVPLVPATYVPGRPAPRPPAVSGAIIEWALRSDWLFWAGLRVAEDRMIEALLATDARLVHAAAAEEQARVRSILRDILPISARARGLLNDARLAGNPAPMPIEQIRAPTLAISVEDDRFGTADAARHIAASVPGARLLMFPSGGHVWVGHDAELFAALGQFLNEVMPPQR